MLNGMARKGNIPKRVLDLAPAVPGDGPAVVFLHGGWESKDLLMHQTPVKAIAAQGTVAFLPSRRPEEGTALFRDDNGVGLREDLASGACAMRNAGAAQPSPLPGAETPR